MSNKTEEVLDLTCKKTLEQVDREIKDYQKEIITEISKHDNLELIVQKYLGKAG